MSDIQIIGARDRIQRAWLFRHIAEVRRAGVPVVLLVPEQYTLQAERDLMAGLNLPGLLDLDVVSPGRLRDLIREKAGSSGRPTLDEAGRAMAIHRALQDCDSQLTYYRQLGSLYGAVSRVDQTLASLREEGMSPEDLEGAAGSARGAARKARYHELSLVWRSYDELLAGRFDDPAASWRDLCARLPAGGLWRGADLCVYGFDTLRPDLRELILAAAPVCASIHVLLTMTSVSDPAGRIFQVQRDSAEALADALEERGHACVIDYPEPGSPRPGDALDFLSCRLFSEGNSVFPEDPSPAVTLFAASHPTAEARAVVSTLLRWHREGIAWNRMAIALPRGAASGTLLSALRRNHIPFFLSRKYQVSRHGVSRLLTAALACVSEGPGTAPLLEAACCGFGALTREEGAFLTRYVTAWGIDRNRWKSPFTRGEDAEEAEALRQRLLAPIDHLHEALRAAGTAEDSVKAVALFLREEDVPAQLQARVDRLTEEGRYSEAVIDRQIWDLLMNLLDELWHLLGGRRATIREMALLLTGALDRAVLSALPEEEEGVAIGRIGHMLPGRTEALILPGMNDGVLHTEETSLFSDAEKRALKAATGKSAGLDQAQMGMLARTDYFRTMTLPERRLFVSYCLRDEAGTALLPGEPVSELRRLFPRLREEGGLLAGDAPADPGTPALAAEGAGPVLREVREGRAEDLPAPWADALRGLARDPVYGASVREMMTRALPANAPRRISAPTAIRLFHSSRVSISRLECFAGCPRKHFIRYGLRPALPRAYEFTAGDAGNFYHEALQRYVNEAVRDSAWPRLREDQVSGIMDRILDSLTLPWEEGPLGEDALGRWQGEGLVRCVRHAASVLTRHAANSDFQVLGTEMEFGSGEGLPPLILSLPDGARVALQGKIDRLDLYRGPDGDYLRVLDLKSSAKELNPARMDRGEQLQLMIYLKAALQSRSGARPAGALYFPVIDPEVDAASSAAADDARMKKVQLKGALLADPDIVRAMDRDILPFSLPSVINKDGSFSKSVKWALPAEVLDQLMDAAVSRAADLCVRIRAGEADASPSAEDRFSACTWCEFASVCPRRKQDERPLPGGMRFEDVGQVPGDAG